MNHLHERLSAERDALFAEAGDLFARERALPLNDPERVTISTRAVAINDRVAAINIERDMLRPIPPVSEVLDRREDAIATLDLLRADNERCKRALLCLGDPLAPGCTIDAKAFRGLWAAQQAIADAIALEVEYLAVVEGLLALMLDADEPAAKSR